MSQATVDAGAWTFPIWDDKPRSKRLKFDQELVPDELTVMLVEGEGSSLFGVREALERRGFAIVAEATDAGKAVKAAIEHRPQICLLDAGIRGGALAASREIYSRLPKTKIAMLADTDAVDQVLCAVHAGIDGYLLKEISPVALAASLRAIADGEAVLPRSSTAPLVQYLRLTTHRMREHHGRLNRTAFYVPRVMRHYHRRRRSKFPRPLAWQSARQRMREYA